MVDTKSDLEDKIRSSYRLIHDYELIIQTSDRPEEKLRSKRQIGQQKEFIRDHLSQYIALCQRLEVEKAEDITEIANFIGVSLTRIKKGRVPAKNNRRKAPRIFISYARKDQQFADEIYQFLCENSYAPWMDTYNLVPGQDWQLEIHRSIKNSDYFIACLSSHSVSKVGYVQKELKEAISILDEMPEGRIYLIPIKIGNCVIPTSLEKRHWLDWTDPNAKELLLRAIQSKK